MQERTARTAAAGALAALALAGLTVAGCGSSGSTRPAIARPAVHTASAAPAAPNAAQLAITRAVAAECAVAGSVNSGIGAAGTVGSFANGVNGWEAQLTAATHIPMTGVPDGTNDAREIQVDFAEANLALFLASVHDNPFGPHFSAGKVRRGYSTAAGKLQDALNRCAAAGQPTS